jgi:hypothetical protein
MVSDPVIINSFVILQRTDQAFIPALLGELGTAGGRAGLTPAATRDANGNLRLFQPVHRTFHLALIDVCCDTFGRPRLDPKKIENAGLVVRRIATDENGKPLNKPKYEGWKKAGQQLRGWIPFASEPEEHLDPEPPRRKPLLNTGNAEINRRLAAMQALAQPLQETVSPLFVAPPDVCAAAKKTFLYGVIPLTSSEYAENKAPKTYSLEFLRQHMSTYLLAADHTRSIRNASQTIGASFASPEDDFIRFLRQLLIEFDAFGDSALAQAVFSALNGLQFTYADGSKKNAGDELKKMAQALVLLDPGQKVLMPKEWPAVSSEQAGRIEQAVKASLDARLAAFTPGLGRFEDSAATYQLRAFVRVKRPDGCPPQIVWSGYSDPFTIVPWYENGALPPVHVTLPDITKENFKNFKPNVTFAVPRKLFNMIQGDPKEMLKGNISEGVDLGIAWICGFNIPVITFCAFIVLYIFLSLLNIVFFWLAFIKICIPFPFPKRS